MILIETVSLKFKILKKKIFKFFKILTESENFEVILRLIKISHVIKESNWMLRRDEFDDAILIIEIIIHYVNNFLLRMIINNMLSLHLNIKGCIIKINIPN